MSSYFLKRYNTTPFQISKHRSTVDTFVVSASGLLLVFNRHILAGSLLEDTASIYCSAFGTATDVVLCGLTFGYRPRSSQ